MKREQLPCSAQMVLKFFDPGMRASSIPVSSAEDVRLALAAESSRRLYTSAILIQSGRIMQTFCRGLSCVEWHACKTNGPMADLGPAPMPTSDDDY
jgi:hypothetical protein